MSVYNNQAMVVGYVGKGVELKETTAGHVAKIRLGVQRSGKGEQTKTDWFDIEAWHDLSRGAANLKIGDRLTVIGSMKVEPTTNKDGLKVTYHTIQAREIGLDVAVKKEGGNEKLSEDSPF